jgi:hypothetical protein
MSALKRHTFRSRRIVFRPDPAGPEIVAELTPDRLSFRRLRCHKSGASSLSLTDLFHVAGRYAEGSLWSGAELAGALTDHSKLKRLEDAWRGHVMALAAATNKEQRAIEAVSFDVALNEIFGEQNSTGANGA